MREYLSKLNKNQHNAATSKEGVYLVIAGAGTGKTSTLVARVAFLIDEGINPCEIALLTFTNKAANEMKERIKDEVGEIADKITASTFHSFCAMLLREHAPLLGFSRSFNILDASDSTDVISMVKETFLSEGENNKKYDLKSFPSSKQIEAVLSKAINNCESISSSIDGFGLNKYTEEIKDIIKRYQSYKRERNLLDYDDLIFYVWGLLKKNPELRKKIDKRYKYICCDEYQDTNKIQYEILQLLTQTERNLMVVGDDNQSIYKFRFANIENILNFENDNPDAKVIILNNNYRSTQEILDVANELMENATEGIEKKLINNRNGKKPKLVICESSYSENNYICEKIISKHRYENIRLSDIAVIARSANQTFGLEMQLNAAGIPYKKFGGKKITEKMAIKTILSYLRVSVNEKDEIAWLRILQLIPGLGVKTAQKIATEIHSGIYVEKYQKKKFYNDVVNLVNNIKEIKTKDLNEQLNTIIDDLYPEMYYNMIENKNIPNSRKNDEIHSFRYKLEEANALKEIAKNYTATEEFLNDIILEPIVDNGEYSDYLNITTIHSAKGLEYDTVFIMDVVNGLTPRCGEYDEESSEERRCFYVALTRAKNNLYLCVPKYHANIKKCKLSYFVSNKMLKLLETEYDGGFYE